MEPVINQLNQMISQRVGSSSIPQVSIQETPSTFAGQLDNKITSRMLEKLSDQMGLNGGQDSMKILSADDIQVAKDQSRQEFEPMEEGEGLFFSQLKKVNDDFLGIENMVDVFSNPDAKFSYQDLIKAQMVTNAISFNVNAGIALTQKATQTFNQAFNMQI